MAAVTIQSVSKQFGSQTVLAEATIELHSGEVTGLVGVNGAGKTTVFRLISGELPPDSGSVTRSRGLKVGYLRQEPQVSPDRTLHEEVGSALADLLALEARIHGVAEEMSAASPDRLPELMAAYDRLNNQFAVAGGHAYEARINEILGGLGFSQADHALPMAVLSGGQKCRAALARLLLEDRQFLLLDEPTNHLDIDAVRWLEKFLAGHHGGAVIISHDRYLLDRLCDRIVEVSGGKLHSYPGNYSNYAQAKQLRELTLQRQFEKDAAFIQKERDFIARHLAGQRSNEAKGRRTRLERRLASGELVTENVRQRRVARLDFDDKVVRGGIVLRCDGLAMRYGDNQLFTDLGFQLAAGERFGITGPNGTGKSTLLKILLGRIEPIAGGVELDRKRTVGYYAQESTSVLDPRQTVLEELRARFPDLSEERARTILGAFLFTGDDVFKRLGSLSGGEQSRVRLACLILESPEILILDEPTNHLDIPSREALEAALDEFPGAIIVVSHDRYFLDQVVDRLLILRRGEHRIHSGNYSSYIEMIDAEKAKAQAADAARNQRTGRTNRPRQRSARLRSPFDDLGLEEIEALIMQRETQLAELNERFGDQEIYKDPARLADLRGRIEVLNSELEQLNTAWEEQVDAM